MDDLESFVLGGDGKNYVAEAEEQIDKAKAEAWNFVLSDPRGIRILSIILFDICRLDAPAYSADAREHARLEGRRSVATEILADQINHPLSDAYLRAIEQHLRDQTRVEQAKRLMDERPDE